MMQFGFFINDRSVCFFNRMVLHDRSWRFTEHIFQLDVDRFHTVSLFEDKLHIVGRFTYHVHRRTFAVGNAPYAGYIFFFHQQAHTFLAFVPHDFLGRQCRVAYWQLAHVDMSAGCFHQFGEAVQVSACTVVVDGDHRVVVRFGNRTDHVGNTFLHFRVGTLYGIQLDTAGILTCVYGRDGTATHTDTVVVTP